MLLANISVAKKIFQNFPEFAVLRRHPSPPAANYDVLVKAASSKVSHFTWGRGISILLFGIDVMHGECYLLFRNQNQF